MLQGSWNSALSCRRIPEIDASEGLRATLVPQFPHLSLPFIVIALTVFDCLFLIVGLRQFDKKAVS